jgi:polo-like kinase 1
VSVNAPGSNGSDNTKTEKDNWNLGGTGPVQFNTLNSKDSARPGTVQQSEFKSTQGLKNVATPSNFASTQPTGSLTNTNKAKPSGKNEVWVKKWVDYSSKYGLGYILSNGMTGVFFNDSTKILLDTKTSTFEYMERKSADKQDVVNTYTLTDYPKELQKKVTLLQHFKSYLDGDAKDATAVEEEAGQKLPTIYVKKWMKTRHAIMFRLSNKIVQVNFTDKTEIILSSENKIVTYVNKKGERSHYPLATALESSNAEMAKRLNYTKEILTHMLNNNINNGQAPTANQPQVEIEGMA